jgi:hypothetical protein
MRQMVELFFLRLPRSLRPRAVRLLHNGRWQSIGQDKLVSRLAVLSQAFEVALDGIRGHGAGLGEGISLGDKPRQGRAGHDKAARLLVSFEEDGVGVLVGGDALFS